MTLSRGVPITMSSSLFVFALGWRSVIASFYCGGEVEVGEESVPMG
jgi:hypothetical protein